LTNFEKYLEFNSKEDKEKQENLLNNINISAEDTKKIKGISKEKNLLIFAEPFCPDCRILVAIVERIRSLNSLCINVEYLSRKDNFGKLNMLSENNKIPCVFLIDGIKVTKILEEYPNTFENSDENILAYRKGQYNQLIINTILNILTKEN
jgi:hypothetical protein